MNYIQLINNAWELREQGILSAQEHDLYCYLVHKCNKLGWKNPFNQSTEIVCAVLGINRNSLTNRRNKLQQLGLIKFKEGITKRKPAEYMLCILKNTLPDTESDTLPDTYTLNKTKHKQNNLFPEEKPKKLKNGFVQPTIEEVKECFYRLSPNLADIDKNVQLFFYHYDSLGWKNSLGAKIERWDSLVGKWCMEITEKQKQKNDTHEKNKPNIEERNNSRYEELSRIKQKSKRS